MSLFESHGSFFIGFQKFCRAIQRFEDLVLPLSMLLYNVTIGIDPQSEKEWMDYMKSNYIPNAMATGLFINTRMFKVLHDSEDGTISYSIQFFAENIDNVQQYLEVFAPKIIEDHRARYANKHVAFMTLLEEI